MSADFEHFAAVQIERAGEAAEDAWLAEGAANIVASLREFSARTADALARGEISETDRLAVLARIDASMAATARLIAEMRR